MNKVNDREPKNFLGDRKIVRCFLENVTKKQAARRQPVFSSDDCALIRKQHPDG
jgi:hypothetical protein